MDILIAAGVVMIWVAVAMILYMTYLGFDVRSRGFKAGGPAFLTLSKLEISLIDYYKKRSQHPVTDEMTAKRAKMYLILTIVALILVIALIITVSVV